MAIQYVDVPTGEVPLEKFLSAGSAYSIVTLGHWHVQYQRPISNLLVNLLATFFSFPWAFHLAFIHFLQVSTLKLARSGPCAGWWARSRSHGGWWNRRVSWVTFGTAFVVKDVKGTVWPSRVHLVAAMGGCGMRCRHWIVIVCKWIVDQTLHKRYHGQQADEWT